MMRGRTLRPKCLFSAWIFGWVTVIYLPSLLFALTRISPLADRGPLLRATFAVADEVAPAAKLSVAPLLGAFMLAARRLTAPRPLPAVLLDMLLALAAMLSVLALLPEAWSRGLGIGMTGERFAPDATAIYALGAMLCGLVFSLTEARCLARMKGKTSSVGPGTGRS